jgi:hypothetical protein
LDFPTFFRAIRGKPMACEAKSLESHFFDGTTRRQGPAEAKSHATKTEILTRRSLPFRIDFRRQSDFRQHFCRNRTRLSFRRATALA